jgi:hypothetical protein
LAWKKIAIDRLIKNLDNIDKTYTESIAVLNKLTNHPFFLGVYLDTEHLKGTARLFPGSYICSLIEKKKVKAGDIITLNYSNSFDEIFQLFYLKKLKIVKGKKVPPHTNRSYFLIPTTIEEITLKDGLIYLKLSIEENVWIKIENLLPPYRPVNLLIEAIISHSRLYLGISDSEEINYIKRLLSNIRRTTENERLLSYIKFIEEMIEGYEKN